MAEDNKSERVLVGVKADGSRLCKADPKDPMTRRPYETIWRHVRAYLLDGQPSAG